MERFEAFGEFCVMFFGFSLGKTSKKHGKTCKNMETQWLYSRLVDNYDIVMRNVI